MAKKAAFDYIDAQKGFIGIALAISLLFCFPLTVALFADSRQQVVCSAQLREGSTKGEMQVVKVKKKRKGHYILNLEFTTPEGAVIKGEDQIITLDETLIPKKLPVLYSPSQPSCWSLTANLGDSEPNWARRRYFAAFTFLFGIFFLSVGLVGTVWAVRRLIVKRPFVRELGEIFSFS